MRLIDALELKRSIACSSILEDGKTLEQIIDEQPAIKPEQRWIPCSEMLPEVYDSYLITTYDGNVDIGTIDPKKQGVWSACDADGFYWLREVTAWMPLPEPYREEGEADETN